MENEEQREQDVKKNKEKTNKHELCHDHVCNVHVYIKAFTYVPVKSQTPILMYIYFVYFVRYFIVAGTFGANRKRLHLSGKHATRQQ